MNKWKKESGFTLVELLIVISIVAILAGILFNRVLFYQELAEKAAMQQVVSALQSALVLEYGHRIANSMGAEINNLSTQNPMDWLAQKPVNYAGEFHALNPAAIEPGNWAYDLSTHELIYVPDRSDHFTPGKDGHKWVRYKVRLIYDPASAASQHGSSNRVATRFTGIVFEASEPCQWMIKGKP